MDEALEIRVAVMCNDVKSIQASVARLEEAIIGNGKPGALMRLDRLEQVAEARKWWLRAVAVAAFSSISLAIKNWINSKG